GDLFQSVGRGENLARHGLVEPPAFDVDDDMDDQRPAAGWLQGPPPAGEGKWDARIRHGFIIRLEMMLVRERRGFLCAASGTSAPPRQVCPGRRGGRTANDSERRK